MKEQDHYYSYLETDLSVIRQNYLNLQKACPQKIIPVAKGNAWGLGTIGVVSMLFDSLGLDTVAVAQVGEAVKIREAGYIDQTIMILSGVPFHAIPYVVKHRLLMMVYNKETVRLLSEEVRNAGLSSFPVQIKVDTGFHRIGVAMEELGGLVDEVLAAGNLEIEGLCSHYADAYTAGSEKTPEQYALFKKVVTWLHREGFIEAEEKARVMDISLAFLLSMLLRQCVRTLLIKRYNVAAASAR
ncbi:MAG: alanine racemase [Lachnospiraceae bacterium]|nr:alanine racemase [Lachnospiraceae bacterium]